MVSPSRQLIAAVMPTRVDAILELGRVAGFYCDKICNLLTFDVDNSQDFALSLYPHGRHGAQESLPIRSMLPVLIITPRFHHCVTLNVQSVLKSMCVSAG